MCTCWPPHELPVVFPFPLSFNRFLHYWQFHTCLWWHIVIFFLRLFPYPLPNFFYIPLNTSALQLQFSFSLSLSGNPLNTGSAYHTCTGAWQSNGSWQSYQWPHIQKSLALSFLETFNHAQLLRKGWNLEIIYPSRPEICLTWPCAGTPAAVSSRVPRKQYLTALLTIHWLLHSFCLLLHNVSWALVVKGLTEIPHLGLSTQSLTLNILRSYESPY